ncbi:MAG: methylmalonyl-CoA carboxyltransferase [Chloroflexi bacterium]|nr:methylmalonyl-CoA carboxyltransferase [Chloroflexota bacterium]
MSLQDELNKVNERRQKLLQGGGAAEVERQHTMGKLTARERLAKLFDPGTFQELDLFIRPLRTGFDVDDRELPADGAITGFGEVHGRPVFAYAHDFTVMGGVQSVGQNHKVSKLVEKAIESGVPYVGMVDSGGIKVHDMFGRTGFRPVVGGSGMAFTSGIFPVPALASGVVPQISLMLGPCYAGSAYAPTMADFVVMRKGTSFMSVASPPLLKAVTFADVTQEQIGGAGLHAAVTGTADFLMETDEQAIETCRELLTYLPLNHREKAPVIDLGDDPQRREESLLAIDMGKPYDMHQVITAVLDKGKFLELQALFAPHMIIGFGRLNGRSVGVVANNPAVNGGALDINTCDKMARFVRWCDAFNVPLVIFVDTAGFQSRAEQERSPDGLVRNAAKPVFALAEATVPRVVVYIGQCFGTARLAMGTLRLGVDSVYAWPSARVARIAPGEAVDAIWGHEIKGADNPAEVREQRLHHLMETYMRFPFHTVEQLMAEDIIDPRDTRPVLIRTLKLLEHKSPTPRPWRKHSLIQR